MEPRVWTQGPSSGNAPLDSSFRQACTQSHFVIIILNFNIIGWEHDYYFKITLKLGSGGEVIPAVPVGDVEASDVRKEVMRKSSSP